ncbi:MAG TPA: TIGR00730 family Rossman fold protein [Burkholderiales bacterium]|nr:TIGR00730 family Rossman fold protein [Burkholderiales bacterium]
MTQEKLLKAAGHGQEISPREAWKLFGIMAEFFEATERLAGIKPAVSVFGSARVKPGTRYYQLAEETARLLSDAGFAVFSGGGPGLMEATNKGAFQGRGMAVGLNIDLPREQPSSRYQHISLRFKHFFARKVMFAKFATAYVVLPGGFGTLDELFEALTLVQTGKTRQMPIILVHEPYWRELIAWMRDRLAAEGMIDPTDLDLLQVCDEPQQVVDVIFAFYEKRGFEPSPAEREVLLNL